jgi:hypothetical protein
MESTRWAALGAFKITPGDFVVRDDSRYYFSQVLIARDY